MQYMVMEGDPTDGVVSTHCTTDGALYNCTPGTCVILLTGVTPTDLILEQVKSQEDFPMLDVEDEEVDVPSQHCYAVYVMSSSVFL